ncbi:hypothetical protein HNY73_007618 [Argiope bruennichi]|uniref:Uncharacterized protein n=1 Tax=Argiope bruennichi TaxID=94029 RepID=A0A8T0FHJ4_ARGBR|nr:hypothetical protein HNY73_007618 [Argiope bruennichi]
MSNEVPRSKLPAYRPSTVRLHKSPVNGILPTRNISKTSCPVPKNDATTGPPKPSPTKQYQNEIAKLKKELTTLKTENSILKVKVRRVDDENVQKSRQIEKLKVELKAAQKVESSNSKKSKDSELLVLRQKCLRLEGALKEKDLALKRLNNEASLKLEGTASRNSITNLAAGDGDDTKWNKLNEICRNSVKPGTAQTSLSRSSHSTKTEVAKLREMIHKLEKENQELQQQVKDKGFKYLTIKTENLLYRMILNGSNCYTGNEFGTLSSDVKCNIQDYNANETHPKLPVTRPRKVTAPSKMIPNSERKNSSENKIDSALENKMVDSLESRQDESSENRKDDTLENEFFNIDDKVKEMRENIAAKKIQRSWRDHQKRHSGKHDQQSIQKALTFIVTSLKHHKLRKEKIGMLRRRKNLSPRIKAEDDSAIVATVQAAVKSIWEKEMSITPVN